MSLPSSSSGSNDNGGNGGGRADVPDDDDDDDEEFYDADPLPILGRCRALYHFDGKTFFKLIQYYCAVVKRDQPGLRIQLQQWSLFFSTTS